MHILITRWFDGCNTYFRARRFDFSNYEDEVLIDFEYGYGEHGLHEAAKLVGFVRETSRGETIADLRAYREAGHTYEIRDVKRKRDL